MFSELVLSGQSVSKDKDTSKGKANGSKEKHCQSARS